jgi:hypothetical protein
VSEKLKAAILAFEDFLNEPPQYEDKRMVRDYRHEAYRKWSELRDQITAALPAQEWQDISTAPNDSVFRWYGLQVKHAKGHEWFEAHYVSHDDDGEMRLPSGDNFDDWAFSDFEFWCDAPPPPVAVIAEERTTK